MATRWHQWNARLTQAGFIPLLLIRLVLAYGFHNPAVKKWNDIDSVAEWFGSMHIPFPTLSAYLAACTETLGFVLLALGLFTRFITIPLMIVMLVAIKTVHWENGFEAANNGYEIPLYYLLMLLMLFCFGPGKISIDRLIERRVEKNS